MTHSPPKPVKAKDIGLKQLNALSNMPPPMRREFLAEGLGIILKSAEELFAASRNLEGHLRASRILEGHAEEEAAKILILMDYVRCPDALSGRASKMLVTFYEHGSRLIYAKACSWRPDTVATLRGYVDQARSSHYIEGSCGEYILPNAEVYARESRQYADLSRMDDGALIWNDPSDGFAIQLSSDAPVSLLLSQAMWRLGMFSKGGLAAIQSVWRDTPFVEKRHARDSDRLIEATLQALIAGALVKDEASDADVAILYRSWQMPMYDIEVGVRHVPLEDLRAAQDSELHDLYS